MRGQRTEARSTEPRHRRHGRWQQVPYGARDVLQTMADHAVATGSCVSAPCTPSLSRLKSQPPHAPPRGKPTLPPQSQSLRLKPIRTRLPLSSSPQAPPPPPHPPHLQARHPHRQGVGAVGATAPPLLNLQQLGDGLLGRAGGVGLKGKRLGSEERRRRGWEVGSRRGRGNGSLGRHHLDAMTWCHAAAGACTVYS